eukprot:COSAG02_NODE_5816_length_4017_cov_4.466820_4_plen_87_part_01
MLFGGGNTDACASRMPALGCSRSAAYMYIEIAPKSLSQGTKMRHEMRFETKRRESRLLGLWSYVGGSGSPRAAPLLVLPRVDFTYEV